MIELESDRILCDMTFRSTIRSNVTSQKYEFYRKILTFKLDFADVLHLNPCLKTLYKFVLTIISETNDLYRHHPFSVCEHVHIRGLKMLALWGILRTN